MPLIPTHSGGGSDGGPGKKADKRKQTIIAFAAVGGLIVAYLTYKAMTDKSATAAAATPNPATATGAESGGTTQGQLDAQTQLDRISALLVQLGNIRPVAGPTGPQGPPGKPGVPGLPGHPVTPPPVHVSPPSHPVAPPVTVAPPSAPAPAPPAQKWYTVMRGDTLTGIAKKIGLGSDWGAILNTNKATITKTAESHGKSASTAASGHWIYPGEKLLEPAPKPTHPATHG